MIRKYVEAGGHLTAEGIANIYACNEALNYSSGWLSQYIEQSIPRKLENMSYQNLKDVIEGLKTNSPSSEHIGSLESAASSKAKEEENVEYVTRLPNEIL